jgi:molybdopterin molybdotransferase
MISFDEACKCIAREVTEAKSYEIPLAESFGKVLARDVIAPLDLPPFDNSAVDGFAIMSCALQHEKHLALGAVVRAQGQREVRHDPLTAMKIMTGAPMPLGADTVAMIEDVVQERDRVIFTKSHAPKENIRFRGEDIRAGDVCARAGKRIDAQTIALCAGLGLTAVPVFLSPEIKLIATGDELVRPGRDLQFGQVYFLMDAMLSAQCARIGISDIDCALVADDASAIAHALDQAFDADIVLMTGGMSKGDYDCARIALKDRGVREIFYQGAWRPGKPLYFGRRGSTLVFGLPGNPVAAFVMFRTFVEHAIGLAMKAGEGASLRTAIARNDMSKKPGLTFFARAKVSDDNGLQFLPGQGSHQLFSLSEANALAVLPEGKAIVKAGEVVHYYCL